MSYQRRRVRVGKVVSESMDKTVVVAVEWKRPHPLYKKPVRRRSRLKAHDADNSCRFGDVVQIIESRPLSKTKKWRVKQIISSVETAEIQPEEITVDADVLTAQVNRPEPEAMVDETISDDGAPEAAGQDEDKKDES